MFSFLYVASFTKDVHVSMPWAEVFPVCGWPATRPHFPLRQDPTPRTSHRHHHPFPHRTTDTRVHADRRPPCADDSGVEWPSSEQPTAGSPSPIIAWQDEMPLPLLTAPEPRWQ